MDYEAIAKLTQKYIASRPVIVLGSGASIPYGLPSMPALAEELLRKMDLKDSAWTKFKYDLEKTKDLEKSLNNVQLTDSLLERIVKETWNITAKKDIQTHQDLLTNKTKLALTCLFQYLLRTANPKLFVVTTNYDRLAEYAANMAKAEVLTGFTSGWIQRFVPDSSSNGLFHSNPSFEGRIQILKVHGSLDWFGKQDQEPIAIPLAREIPENRTPLIVTPGISKYREVHKDPFRSIMAWSDGVLKKASCFLCIGFGFNDEHVQPILVDRIRNDHIPIVIVTKKLSEAARKAFLENPPKNFLILEEDKSGTTVYCLDCPSGEVLTNHQLWNLPNFLNMLLGEEGVAL
ncbi:MAG: SIR2 family protein [Nitrospinae bacterium]|nr:SIR2 family protein [Nitrospinota bacterium]